jgi:hypothetical protein
VRAAQCGGACIALLPSLLHRCTGSPDKASARLRAPTTVCRGWREDAGMPGMAGGDAGMPPAVAGVDRRWADRSDHRAMAVMGRVPCPQGLDHGDVSSPME